MNKYRVTFAYPLPGIDGEDWHTKQVIVRAGSEYRAIEIVKLHWRKAKWFEVEVVELEV